MSRRQGPQLAALLSISLLTACNVDVGAPVDTTTPAVIYVGSFANATESGTLSLSLAAVATGSLVQLNGNTTALTGTYSATSGAVLLTGGGSTLTGTLASNVLAGTYASPNGTGKFSAEAQGNTGATPPKEYCGTYENSSDYGWLDLVDSSTGIVSGFAVSGAGGPGTAVSITGTLAGTTLAAMTNQSTAITGAVSGDGTTITGTYPPRSTSQSATGTFQASTSLCNTSSGATTATTAAGYWGTDPVLSTVVNVVFTQNGTALGGSGALHTSLVSGYTGDFFRITSGSFDGTNLSFTAQLGANPVGDGTFYYGTLSFSGVESSLSTVTGTLTYTPPRTCCVTFAQQSVAGVTIMR